MITDKAGTQQTQLPAQTWAYGQEAEVQKALQVQEDVLKGQIT